MRTLLVATAAALSFAALPAAADGGFALGASAGYTTVSDSFDDADFDGSDVGYKAFATWMWSDYFGIEGGYIDFGEPSDDILDVPTSIDATGWNLYLVGNIPVTDSLDIFAKVGGVRWDADLFVDGFPVDSDDGQDLAVSGGLRWNISDNFGIRGELDWYDISETDAAWMAGVGIEFRF